MIPVKRSISCEFLHPFSVPSTELVPLSTEVYVNINTSPNIIDSSDVINDVNVHQATSSYQSSDIHSDLDSGKLSR